VFSEVCQLKFTTPVDSSVNMGMQLFLFSGVIKAAAPGTGIEGLEHDQQNSSVKIKTKIFKLFLIA